MKYSITLTLEQEKKLLGIKSTEDGISVIRSAFHKYNLDISEEAAEDLLRTAADRIRISYQDPLYAQGFIVRVKPGGTKYLYRYGRRLINILVDTGDRDDRMVRMQDIRMINDRNTFTAIKGEPELTIPAGITELGPYCFFRSSGIRKLIVPDSVKTIGNGAFSRSMDLEEVILPKSIVSIGTDAFSECTKLRHITIPDSVSVIEDGAFTGCKNLRSADIPSSVIQIGHMAFCGCEALKKMKLPASLKKIGYGAFMRCTCLKELEIPAGFVFPVEKHVFAGCRELDTSGFRFGPSSEESICEMPDDLCNALDTYAQTFMNGTNETYSFAWNEIEQPDEKYIQAETDASEWEKEFHDSLNTVINDEEVLDALSAMIADTMRRLGARIFSDTAEGRIFYQKHLDYFSAVDLHFVCIRNKWYAIGYDWSD